MKKVLSFILALLLVVTLSACGDNDIPKDLLDCINNPDGEGCDIIDPTDDRSTEEIIVDGIIDNFDGDLTHLTVLMDELNLSDSIQVVSEFSFSISDIEEFHYIQVVVTDNMVTTDNGLLLHRVVDYDFDGETTTFEFILEEVPTGVIAYFNFAPLRADILAAGGDELLELLDAIEANEDWFMFKFDDSLTNLIEIEIVKEIIISAFFEEFGERFFYDLQAELDLDLTINDLSTYGIDIGLFIDYLLDGEFTSAETMLDSVLYEDLIFDLDAAYLVPEIVNVLYMFKAELDLALFATDDHMINVVLLGTEAWLDSLTEEEIIILSNIIIDPNAAEGDPTLSEVLTHYYAGTLDHFLMMWFLNEESVAYELSNIPGFDFTLFKTTMDNLDYDAFYLEEANLALLFEAIYTGQDAYDLYLIDLAITAPQTASILSAYSGLVSEMEIYKVAFDDIEYALNNLSMFDEFFTLDYYLDNDLINVDMEKTDDLGILTTVTLEPIAYAFVFQDLIEEAVLYLDGFQSFELPYFESINCPVGENCETLPGYEEFMENLALLGEVEYTVLYDPSNPTEVITKIDFTEFSNSLLLINDPEATEEILNLSFLVTVRENATVTVPTLVNDVNELALEFAKFSLSLIAQDALREVGYHYFYKPFEILEFGERRQLDTFEEYLNLSLAFDSSLSYVEMGGSISSPELTIQLFWHDGTPVFVSPIGAEELDSIFGYEPSGTFTTEIYQSYIDNVVLENFNMTKLLFVYIFNNNYFNTYNNDVYYPE